MNLAGLMSEPFPSPSGSAIAPSGSRPQASKVPSGTAANPAGTFGPAVRVTLTDSATTSSERLLTYGPSRSAAEGPGAAIPDATGAAPENPADVLDRKIAESRKELAAIQIKQLKAASRDAGVLALLNPQGALSFAKHAAKTLSGAAQTLRESERTIAGIEDKNVAETPSDEITAIAHDVASQTVTLEIEIGPGSGESQELEAAIRHRSASAAGSPEPRTTTDAGSLIRLTQTTRVEATTIVTVQDESARAAKAADVAADRSARLGEDAEALKDAVSTLRSLYRIINTATKKLQETGALDQRMAGEVAETREAFFDAVAETAAAALPVVQAGYSISPDDEG